MGKLFLGVENLAYSDPNAKGITTTEGVAKVLEEKYHVMRVFVEAHGKEIADDIGKALTDDLDALMHGERISAVPLDGAMKIIEKRFGDYLDADEWQQTTGQAIAAAQNGVNHRKENLMNTRFMRVGGGKNGKGSTMVLRTGKQRGPRPAFIDTGLYQSSFRAWVKL
jgi:limonene-1,2-epoxide hydrolase